LGEVSGSLQLKKLKYPVVLNLRALSAKKLKLRTVVKKSAKFYFPYVPEGQYQLSGFVDENKNGRFDSGKLMPFQFCEPFTFSEDTIRVRKRWETSGIKFKLPIKEEEP